MRPRSSGQNRSGPGSAKGFRSTALRAERHEHEAAGAHLDAEVPEPAVHVAVRAGELAEIDRRLLRLGLDGK